ncbi:MAG: chromosome segregation protein SMC [Clostridia bacterium]|nr:chromosome segregation protein SMC [Clostridia bacterium]
MNFTKIEIIGFKSFANKTEIRFDHGITGIVGPNGCGKSNVADAVRWVLGEQSPKTLRGSSMQDVIFNGTQSRKSLSYCEVSLFFDNSTGIFKSEEYTEVILTRKLYRSGESEYYINKKPRRLKDIVNLLHECGLSKEGYTIIGQNKVTEILSSKPEDRRAIFEEAVGIAKTKAQRQETERKLQKTQDNITRFSDMCMDLERQLAPLSRQAETARTYNAYAEELKKHEVNSYLYKVENAAGEKSAIQTRLQGITEDLEVKNADYAAAEKLYADSMDSVGKSDEIIKSLNDEILEKTVGLETQKGNVKLTGQKVEFFSGEIDRLKNQNNENQNKINELSSGLAEKKSFALKAENEKEALTDRVNRLGEKLVTLMTEINEKESEAKDDTNQVIASLQSLTDIKSSLSSLEAEQSVISTHQKETLDKVEELKNKLTQHNNEKLVLTESISSVNKAISSLNDEIEASANGVRVTNEKLFDINNKLSKYNNSITTLEANERFYRGLKDSFEGYQEAVRRLMGESKENKEVGKRIKNVVASIVHTERQYEVAIEIAMGNAIQFIVTANEDDAAYLIEYLKKNGWGRATFLPVSAVKYRPDSAETLSALKDKGALGMAAKLVKYDPYYEPIIRYLLGNTLVCDTLDNAKTIAKKYRFAFKIVTLDGDVLSPQGTMTGGSRKQNSSNLLSIDGKVEAIRKDLEAYKVEYDAANKRKAQYEKTLAGLNADLAAMNADLNEKKQALGVLKEKLTQCESAIAETEKEIDAYRDALKEINTRLDEIKRQTTFAEDNMLRAERRKNESSARISNVNNEELKKERDKLIEENTSCQTRLATLKSELTANSAEISRLTDEITALRNSIRENDATISANTDIIKKLKADMEQIVLSSEEQQVVGALREKLAKAEAKKEQLQRNIERANNMRAMLNTEISQLSADKIKEEYNLEKVDTDLRYSAEKLMEDYNLTYEDCLELKIEGYDIKTSASEIEKIKRKIRGLGPINNNAIEDYEAINSIYQDNILQKQDLEKGADDLRKGIQALTDEMTEKFNGGFEVIRANFRKIFKELFGGGSADLLLDYEGCDDPLDAGVEIVAEPPGKKLQKISLLSGGEMALTAIAILFAILRLCPMPFCVLDEIEAALDEANVERFARYLKNFSADTQFIVITHKKVTMELADALFGVTMQEKGVSSIVSVELADVANEAIN